MSKYVPEYLAAIAANPESVADLIHAVERALWTQRHLLQEDGICPAATEDLRAKANAFRLAIGAGPLD